MIPCTKVEFKMNYIVIPVFIDKGYCDANLSISVTLVVHTLWIVQNQLELEYTDIDQLKENGCIQMSLTKSTITCVLTWSLKLS